VTTIVFWFLVIMGLTVLALLKYDRMVSRRSINKMQSKMVADRAYKTREDMNVTNRR